MLSITNTVNQLAGLVAPYIVGVLTNGQVQHHMLPRLFHFNDLNTRTYDVFSLMNVFTLSKLLPTFRQNAVCKSHIPLNENTCISFVYIYVVQYIYNLDSCHETVQGMNAYEMV